ncbi:hypothetical protein Pint_27586 [Pistacia integerrima]|uniref:Uncharacterized protein n=1 Tax=Pistacia integerrima TaxID=434235 RepID=A0ACC0YNM5_9ROSI|nr:hypothetical protein Pint_27586 [Pistacia integerrima]
MCQKSFLLVPINRAEEEGKGKGDRGMACEKSKILIIGATGYLGKYMVNASVSMGHSTFAFVRPLKPNAHPSKLQLHQEFQSMGVTVFQGEIDEHEKLVSVLRQVVSRQINQQQIMQIFRPRSRQITQQQIMQIANHADIQTKNCATDFCN